MKTRTGYLVKRGGTFYAVWTVAGKKYIKTTKKTTRKEAKGELARIMEPFMVEDETRTLKNIAARIQQNKGDLVTFEDANNPPLTLGEAWTAYLRAQNRPDTGKATMGKYELTWGRFWQWMREKHPEVKAMRDVSPDIAAEFAEHLTAEGRSPNTFNKYMNLLALVFRVLKDKARLTANPWEDVNRKRLVTNGRRELTVDELRRVCADTTGEMRLLFALGIYTGLRLGDCATLRWGEVDLVRHLITRIPNKTGRRSPKPVKVPVHPTLGAMLAEIPPAGRQGYVLPRIAKDYLRHSSYVTDRIQSHFINRGVTVHRPGTGFETVIGDDSKPKQVHTGTRAILEVGFHSLRHTFVSLCRAADTPLSVVEAIVGHSNPAMTRHYTHTGDAAALAAVSALPSVMGGVKALPPAPKPRTIDADVVRGVAEGLSGKNWKAVKDELLKLTDISGVGEQSDGSAS